MQARASPPRAPGGSAQDAEPGLEGVGDRGCGDGAAEAVGRRRRPALSHRRTDLGAYLLGQLPPPTLAPAAARAPAPASGGPARGPLPRRPPPGSAELAARCPAERRGARPPDEAPEVINNPGGRGRLLPPARRARPSGGPLGKAGREAAREEERGPLKAGKQEERQGRSAPGSEGHEPNPPPQHTRTSAHAHTSNAHGRPWHRCGREERSGDTLEKVKSKPQTGADARHVQLAKVKHQKYIKNSCKSIGGKTQNIRQKN